MKSFQLNLLYPIVIATTENKQELLHVTDDMTHVQDTSYIFESKATSMLTNRHAQKSKSRKLMVFVLYTALAYVINGAHVEKDVARVANMLHV